MSLHPWSKKQTDLEVVYTYGDTNCDEYYVTVLIQEKRDMQIVLWVNNFDNGAWALSLRFDVRMTLEHLRCAVGWMAQSVCVHNPEHIGSLHVLADFLHDVC